MKKKLPLLAFFCLLQSGNAQEPDELVKLRDQYVSAANRAIEPLSKKYIERLEAMKLDFARNGKARESSYVENEILKINAAKDAGFVNIPSTTGNDIQAVAEDPKVKFGEELKMLYGTWKSSDERITFEFKPGKKVAYTQEYATSGGGTTSSTNMYDAKEEGDRIIINKKSDDRSEYKSWYEINMPFSLIELEITYHSVHSQGSTKTTYRLKRVEAK